MLMNVPINLLTTLNTVHCLRLNSATGNIQLEPPGPHINAYPSAKDQVLLLTSLFVHFSKQWGVGTHAVSEYIFYHMFWWVVLMELELVPLCGLQVKRQTEQWKIKTRLSAPSAVPNLELRAPMGTQDYQRGHEWLMESWAEKPGAPSWPLLPCSGRSVVPGPPTENPFLPLPCTHLWRCGGAACRSSAPLWRSSPPRCSRARTWTPPGARAPSAAPACCCTAARPPWARGPAGGPRRRRPGGCGCGACWGSVRAPPRCAGTSARPGWWTGTCWARAPETHRRSAAAAAARRGGATLSGEETGVGAEVRIQLKQLKSPRWTGTRAERRHRAPCVKS